MLAADFWFGLSVHNMRYNYNFDKTKKCQTRVWETKKGDGGGQRQEAAGYKNVLDIKIGGGEN